MRSACPLCGNRALVKHCESHNCTWLKCDNACMGYGDATRWADPKSNR